MPTEASVLDDKNAPDGRENPHGGALVDGGVIPALILYTQVLREVLTLPSQQKNKKENFQLPNQFSRLRLASQALPSPQAGVKPSAVSPKTQTPLQRRAQLLNPPRKSAAVKLPNASPSSRRSRKRLHPRGKSPKSAAVLF